MDIGIDTIVYIVLGVIFVVAQASRKKKTAEKAHVPDNDEYEEYADTPPPSVLQEFLDMQNPKGYDPDPIEKIEVPKKEISPLSSAKSIQYESSAADFMMTGPMYDKNDLTNQDLAEEKSKLKSKLDFNLRKAIIYSAILERKYF